MMPVSLSNMNPELYAAQYASKNGISLEQARTQLKAKYGDPKEQNQNVPDLSSINFNNSNTYGSLALNDPEAEVANYVKRFGVSFEDARAALKGEFGDPSDFDESIISQDSLSSDYTKKSEYEFTNYIPNQNNSYFQTNQNLKRLWGGLFGYFA